MKLLGHLFYENTKYNTIQKYYTCKICKLIIYLNKEYYYISKYNKSFNLPGPNILNISCDEVIIKSII